jgi:glycosyltransferase involved in cell wall biosynthesis
LILTGSFPATPSDETCGYVRDFARTLAAEFEVTVLAPPDENGSNWPAADFHLRRSRSLVPLEIDPFQASVDFNNLASRGIATKIAAAVSAAGFLKDAVGLARRADIICSHWLLPSGLVGAIVSQLTGKPHVAVEHSGALHLLASMRGGRSIARFIARRSDRIITVSGDLKTRLAALCPEAEGKTEVIPMGVTVNEDGSDDGKLSQESKPGRTVLFIGRVTRVKGVDLLLQAAAGIEGLRSIIAGDGDERARLERMARDLRVDAVFLGKTDATRRDELLAVADAVVIPSRVMEGGRTEGMPVVCLEAMASGRVVIASRVGGLPEIIVDGHNGLLFEPGDTAMLAGLLARVTNDEELRLSISARARATARNYSWPRIGARFSRAIKECLKKDGSILYDRRRAAEGGD